jgi:hypothetical protein
VIDVSATGTEESMSCLFEFLKDYRKYNKQESLLIIPLSLLSSDEVELGPLDNPLTSLKLGFFSMQNRRE